MYGRPSDAVRQAARLIGGRYRVEQVMGSGGMGTVWRGFDLRLDRPVAIKVLSSEGLSLPRAMERFDREARAIARLSHPNIVPVYDSAAEGGVPYLVMELVDGPTVADLLAAGPLPVADVLAISAQVCDGLTAAHAAGIVHRDIKPSNLIVTATGVVKICDFGVARMLDAAEHAHLTGSVIAMGSPKYMAPEHINGDQIDPRADLYGLGCSMYTMLTGHPPFSTGSPQSIAHQHLAAVPAPLRARRPDVPADVEALVADLLAKTPDERPPNAAVVRARIAAAAGPITVAPAARPRLWPWVAAAAGVTAAVIVTAFIAALPPADQSGSQSGAQAQPLTATDSPAAAGPSPSAARVTAAPATARAQPQPSPTQSASPSPADPIVTMRQVIQQQVDAGDLKADAARDLNHMVDDLAKTLATDNPADETKKIKALRDKLTGLHHDGRLTDLAYTALNSNLDALATGS